jgi:hypothetical protein
MGVRRGTTMLAEDDFCCCEHVAIKNLEREERKSRVRTKSEFCFFQNARRALELGSPRHVLEFVRYRSFPVACSMPTSRAEFFSQ